MVSRLLNSVVLIALSLQLTSVSFAATKVDSFVVDDRGVSIQQGHDDNLPWRTRDALTFLKSLDFAESKSNLFSLEPSLITSTPYKFLQDRVRKVTNQKVGDSECSGGVAGYYTKFDPSNPRKFDPQMVLCPDALNNTQLTFAGTLIHEARHADGFDHVVCEHGEYSTPILSQQYACDPSLKFRGSYAVEYEFLRRVARSVQVAEQTRQEARSSAVRLLVDRFNELPQGLKAGIALESSERNELDFYNGETTEHLLNFPTRDSMMSSEYMSLTFYDAPTGAFYRYDYVRDQFSKIEWEDSKLVRESLRDVGISGVAKCSLFEKHMSCHNYFEPNEEDVDVVFDKGFTGKRFAMLDRNLIDSRLPPRTTTYFIATSDGAQESGQEFVAVLPEDWKNFAGGIRFQYDSDAAKFFSQYISATRTLIPKKEKDLQFRLTIEGQLVLYRSGKISPAPGSTHKYKRLLAPFVWSADLENL